MTLMTFAGRRSILAPDGTLRFTVQAEFQARRANASTSNTVKFSGGVNGSDVLPACSAIAAGVVSNFRTATVARVANALYQRRSVRDRNGRASYV